MNFSQLLKQAQQMQKKVNKAKKTFNEKIFDFSSQDEIITGKMNGNLEVVELHIKDNYMNQEHQQDIEDLLVVTLNKLIKEINQEKDETINEITNGIDVSMFL